VNGWLLAALALALVILGASRAFSLVDARWRIERPERGPRPWWLNPWALVAVQLGLFLVLFAVSGGRFVFLVLFLPFLFSLRPRGPRSRAAARGEVADDDGGGGTPGTAA
jgi:hypothetical protein